MQITRRLKDDDHIITKIGKGEDAAIRNKERQYTPRLVGASTPHARKKRVMLVVRSFGLLTASGLR